MIAPVDVPEELDQLKSLIGSLSVDRLAVAVSGGPDSMALIHMMSSILPDLPHPPEIQALVVDHRIRAESSVEARKVGEWLENIQGVKPEILTIEGEWASSSLQEEARKRRYEILKAHCHKTGIATLLTAHHKDDQAETFLFRLSRGSGLDGLSAMTEKTRLDDRITLLRPLLSWKKDEILRYCADHHLPYVQDPSNYAQKYSRGRLRKSWNVLEKEGLTSDRLSATAHRLERARKALDFFTAEKMKLLLSQNTQQKKVFIFSSLQKCPQEIRLRLIMQAMKSLVPEKEYGPRYHKLEDLENHMFENNQFEKRSLGKCLLSIDRAKDEFIIEKE